MMGTKQSYIEKEDEVGGRWMSERGEFRVRAPKKIHLTNPKHGIFLLKSKSNE